MIFCFSSVELNLESLSMTGMIETDGKKLIIISIPEINLKDFKSMNLSFFTLLIFDSQYPIIHIYKV
jgi:hypothetical protein